MTSDEQASSRRGEVRMVQIVGINAFHLAHHKTYDEGVRKELPDAMYFGSLGKSALFWRADQVVLVGTPETLFLQPSGGPRTCVRAQFKKVGASTPGGHFMATLFRTLSGSPKSDVSIDALNPLQFKQDRMGS